jgi:hypothetical protein
MSNPTDSLYLSDDEEEAGVRTSTSTPWQLEPQPQQLRDVDELEGTLLPIAQQVLFDNDDDNTIMMTAPTAAPVQVFHYDSNEESQQQHQLQQEEDTGTTRIAYPIPTRRGDGGRPHNTDSISDDSKLAVKHAEHTGLIRSEEELDAIRRARTKVYSENYYERQAIQLANQNAQRRDKEGLQVMVQSKSTSKAANSVADGGPNTSGECGMDVGHDVQEYQIGETSYETTDYHIAEYKSIYD